MPVDLEPSSRFRSRISPEEWQQRVDLAAAYRLVALYGWDDLIFTHLSARVPGPEHHYLINPYGAMFEEVTASSLLKIDIDGNKVDDGPGVVFRPAFVIHGAVHEARDDAGAVMHLHTQTGQAVAAMKVGLLPYSQTAMTVLSELSYHDLEGLATDLDERARIVADLGDKNLMILRNHGTMAIGSTVGEAFVRMYYLERACEQQVLACSAAGIDGLNIPNDGVADKIEGQANAAQLQVMARDFAWPALLRKLDRIDPSYRN